MMMCMMSDGEMDEDDGNDDGVGWGEVGYDGGGVSK
jgi:hypothetical protein